MHQHPLRHPRLLLSLLCALLCGAFCCAHPAPAKAPTYYHASPLVHLQLHADVDFTPLERTLVDEAIQDLEWQTAGYLLVDLEYDLDFTDANVLERGNFIVRQPEWSPLVMMLDTKKNGRVLGFTLPVQHETFLVADRLPTVSLFKHVVMHELLHMAGLDDLPESRTDIMSGASFDGAAPLCMSRVDATEFCRANRCDATKLNGCGT